MMTHIDRAHPALAAALAKRGYETLTQVQEAVLAPALETADLLVSAQTGSGKTVAFGLAIAPTLLGEAQTFSRAENPLTLVIAPTRELALQVKRELDWLYKDTGAHTASCVGGMDMRDERRALSRGAHIVVGTPGRLCDHIKRGSLDMGGIKALILDEADEMLKMGFREELDMILDAAPADRRTLLFSATVPKTIMGMAKKYTRDAVRVNTAAEAKQHVDIQYRALVVDKADRENAIINVLRYYDAKNAIVFENTRIAVNRMVSRFNNRGFSVVALSGELSQKERSNALQSLRDGRAKVCIATDVAARGLDLPDLELVIHADVPKNPEALLHRSGRTGRAGRKGVSALIVTHNARRKTERLFQAAKIKAEWAAAPTLEEVLERDNERLLSDPLFNEEIKEGETEIIAKILEAYTPEQIAAGFLRQYRSGQTSPEELTNAPFDPSDDRSRDRSPRKPRARNDFEGGIWYALNLGRKQKAEPRWILPMLFKSGDLQKGEIGSIKIAETTTYVEISPSGLERFKKAIGPDGKIEKAITAFPVDGVPDFKAEPRPPRGKPQSRHDDNKDYVPQKKAYKDKGPKKKPYEDKGPKKKPYTKPNEITDSESSDFVDYSTRDISAYDDPEDINTMPADKPQGKKPHKKKLAKAKARQEKAARGGGRANRQNTGKPSSGKPKSGGAGKKGKSAPRHVGNKLTRRKRD